MLLHMPRRDQGMGGCEVCGPVARGPARSGRADPPSPIDDPGPAPLYRGLAARGALLSPFRPPAARIRHSGIMGYK